MDISIPGPLIDQRRDAKSVGGNAESHRIRSPMYLESWIYVVGDELLYREEIVRSSGRMMYHFDAIDAIDAEATPMEVR